MSKETKLTDEELKTIKNARNGFDELTVKFGQVEVEITNLSSTKEMLINYGARSGPGKFRFETLATWLKWKFPNKNPPLRNQRNRPAPHRRPADFLRFWVPRLEGNFEIP